MTIISWMLIAMGVAYVGAMYMPMLQTHVGGFWVAGRSQSATPHTAEQRRVYEALNRPKAEIEPAKIYMLAINEVKGCFVRFFFYADTGIVKRSIWMPSTTAAKKIHAASGTNQVKPLRNAISKDNLAAMRRLSMRDVKLDAPWNSKVKDLYEHTMQECKEMLAVLEVTLSKPVTRKRASAKDQTEVAQLVVLPPEETPAVDAAPENASFEAKPAPIGDVHDDVTVIWHGYASFPDPKRPGKTFACYSLDIKYGDGTKNRLKGADLQRAIEAAGVTRLDRIKVYKVKEMQPVGQQTGQDGEMHRGKILWHIEKL